MDYIKVDDLTKTIKGVTILENINLNIKKNYIYGFVGANGSGKTMLFRILSGLVKPTFGHVTIDNKELYKDISFPSNMGILIESPGFWEQYTGYENLKILASIRKVINDEDIVNIMSRIGLDPQNKIKFGKYSLGMKQKLGIAQALMEKPDLIILDEPTNALDDESVNNIRNILLEEKKRGATILIASHNKEDISILSDYIYKINGGKIAEVRGDVSES
ncbi:ATP-binding cassette domain-containing protein [Clostridium uliginosum]|uniref:ABC-2 type transport system ATP-binding protein n=1 Tax=Clostridium uliginosum TaxID=119641 RepID=A0A1I1P5L4_9CLOT|nr:ATP-binding cassette domain-containing protein [Clostridium uliginosum]SFD02958.1 ABC-2 type transport system ATP-binding protein [Clostridium uliginosum]